MRMDILEKGLTRVAASLTAIALVVILTEGGRAAPSSPDEPKLRLLEEPHPLPELPLIDAKGRQLSLADFRGRTVLLNIWATWCAPCRKEMPSLDRLQALLGGPDFEVVALSLDEGGGADIEAFYAEIRLEHLAIYVDSSGAAMRALRIIGVPTTLLVDPGGNEIGRAIGPDRWDTPATIQFLQEQMQRIATP